MGPHENLDGGGTTMGQVDRSRRRGGCVGDPATRTCTDPLDNTPLIDGFVS